ncbi:hypothetical protein Tco_1016570 [Tanacetum coccineum]|uniref:Uncharacterized protein n=1 Tax=Tanacetum coccineum TaxID=301880 RepID=A0ABQ5FP04_9ASTR
MSDGGRGNETILHMLCIDDSLLNVLVLVKWELHVEMVEEGFLLESREEGLLVVVEHHLKKKERDEGGGIVRERVVSIIAWCGCGEASLEEVEETLEQSLGLLEFRRLSSFDRWKLVEIVNGVEESSEEHGIWKSHLTTLSHAHHSLDDVVGEVKGFADGETIKHVAKRHVWMIFMTDERNDIFIENEVPFVEGILELGVKHLK